MGEIPCRFRHVSDILKNHSKSCRLWCWRHAQQPGDMSLRFRAIPHWSKDLTRCCFTMAMLLAEFCYNMFDLVFDGIWISKSSLRWLWWTTWTSQEVPDQSSSAKFWINQIYSIMFFFDFEAGTAGDVSVSGILFSSFCPAQVCEACEHVHDTLDDLSELGSSFLPSAAVCECLRYFTAIAHQHTPTVSSHAPCCCQGWDSLACFFVIYECIALALFSWEVVWTLVSGSVASFTRRTCWDDSLGLLWLWWVHVSGCHWLDRSSTFISFKRVSRVGDAQWMQSPMRHQGTTLLVHRLPPLVLHWLQSPWGEDRDEAYEGLHRHGWHGIDCIDGTWRHCSLTWSNTLYVPMQLEVLPHYAKTWMSLVWCSELPTFWTWSKQPRSC